MIRVPEALRALAWVALLLTAGCAAPPPVAQPQGTVVLLPDRDGKDSALVVTQAGAAPLVLDRPYQAARLSSAGPQAQEVGAQEVQQRFGAALAAQPSAPTRFTLYFVEGKDEFTDESRRQIDGILAEIARRPVPDVLVIGHTDNVGSDAINDPLSRQRAEVVRRALIGRGLAPEKVQAVGRGKREPDVPAAEGVPEPRNRRVEIQVR